MVDQGNERKTAQARDPAEERSDFGQGEVARQALVGRELHGHGGEEAGQLSTARLGTRAARADWALPWRPRECPRTGVSAPRRAEGSLDGPEVCLRM